MKKEYSLLIVISYLIVFTGILVYFSYNLITALDNRFIDFKLLFSCMLIGSFGGVLYCFRGTYLNYCVKDIWSDKWIPWYIIRPFVSIICGGVSYLFLKAGLLILEAQKNPEATNLGFYAFAFIAGMNVDNFLKKIEEIAETTWGITKSRSSKSNE